MLDPWIKIMIPFRLSVHDKKVTGMIFYTDG